jgi:hypothetical protein
MRFMLDATIEITVVLVELPLEMVGVTCQVHEFGEDGPFDTGDATHEQSVWRNDYLLDNPNTGPVWYGNLPMC